MLTRMAILSKLQDNEALIIDDLKLPEAKRHFLPEQITRAVEFASKKCAS